MCFLPVMNWNKVEGQKGYFNSEGDLTHHQRSKYEMVSVSITASFLVINLWLWRLPLYNYNCNHHSITISRLHVPFFNLPRHTTFSKILQKYLFNWMFLLFWCPLKFKKYSSQIVKVTSLLSKLLHY